MDDLIYNQQEIPKQQWRYGFRSSAATGCGWIACYNVLRLLRYRLAPEKLIRYFQWQLPLIHGNAGTSIIGVLLFFLQQGFPVKITARRSRFDEMAKQSDACVLYYRWRKKFKFGAHFVALRYCSGTFTGYNTYKTSTGPDPYGESLEAFLKKRKYFCPVLICIRDKR